MLADLDVQEILDYISERGSAYAAGRFADKLASRFRKLANIPELGRSRDELRAGLRSFAVGNYLIFYTVTPDSINIHRVLHGARDIDAIFGGET